MLTIFSIPKPFIGHFDTIQRNAINSWRRLEPKCEIILFGDDEGVAEIAKEFSLEHVSNIKKNNFGTPLLGSAFSNAQKIANNDILMYANADVIFFQNIIHAIMKVDRKSFLVCGRRWDLDIREHIDLADSNWENNILKMNNKEGKLHGYAGVDYFLFPKNMITMPEFSVGRPGWDNWLIYDTRMRRIPVIDATEMVTVIHQSHDYTHSEYCEEYRVGGPELKENTKIAGGGSNMMTLREADWILKENGVEKPKIFYRILSILSKYSIWRWVLGLKRTIRGEV